MIPDWPHEKRRHVRGRAHPFLASFAKYRKHLHAPPASLLCTGCGSVPKAFVRMGPISKSNPPRFCRGGATTPAQIRCGTTCPSSGSGFPATRYFLRVPFRALENEPESRPPTQALDSVKHFPSFSPRLDRCSAQPALDIPLPHQPSVLPFRQARKRSGPFSTIVPVRMLSERRRNVKRSPQDSWSRFNDSATSTSVGSEVLLRASRLLGFGQSGA